MSYVSTNIIVLIIALTLLNVPALGDTIPVSVVDNYKPLSPISKALWPTASTYAKEKIYLIETTRHFNPNSKEDNLDILAVGAYDAYIIQDPNKELANNIDEKSYEEGFKDSHHLFEATKDPAPSTGGIIKSLSRHLAQGCNNAMLHTAMMGWPNTSNNFLPMPSYIRTITPYNSPFPAYQVSNY